MGGRSDKDEYMPGSSAETDPTVHLFPPLPANSKEMPASCLIGEEGDYGYKCFPYKFSCVRYALLIFLYLCTAGLLWLVFYWRPDWKLKFTHTPCSFAAKVDSVLLVARDGTDRLFVAAIKTGDSEMKKCAPHLFSEKRHSGMVEEKETFENYQNDDNSCDSQSSAHNQSKVTIEGDSVMYFIHQYIKYVWEENHQTFVRVEGYDSNVKFQVIHDASNRGLTQADQMKYQALYGENVIHVEVPPYLKLLMSEVLNPFYVFQLFACIFWMFDEYYAYATAIIVISTISAIVSLFNVRHERQSLHDMVERHNVGRVTVVQSVSVQRSSVDFPSSSHTEHMIENYTTDEIWTKDLVPGDVVMIPPSGITLSFDAALISGTCIVNESMLTGESIPVTKTPLASSEREMKKIYSVTTQKAHTLFCGTEVIQTRYYRDKPVRAVVVRTGFGTAKGGLVHSILFPKPVDLKLLRDAYRFVGIMFGISLCGFAYSCYISIVNEEAVSEIFLQSIDIITITVPPALPLAMTIGIIYAQVRLKKANIHTVSPQRINICGLTDVVAFDKTGTLTEDGLDLTHIIPAQSNFFSLPLSPEDLMATDKKSDIIRCMTTCHSLTLIENEVTGDPLDVKMFEATGWELIEPKIEDESKYDQLQMTYVRPGKKPEDDISLSTEIFCNSTKEGQLPPHSSQSEYELGIVRQFPFLSDLQRSSVIVKPLRSDSRDMMVYVKGAPEMIASLCIPESVPPDFTNLLKSYTQQGHRVIALSYKHMNITWLKAQKIERDLIEKYLTFLGLLILQNKLKPNSADVLRDLDNALIRTVMVTGDNLETAMCVAYDCKLLKPNIPVLIAKTGEGKVQGFPSRPTLTWKLAEDRKDQRGDLPFHKQKISPLSSSEECDHTDTIVNMGDSNSPYDCQLALTGKDFSIIREHFPQFLPALAVQGTVFARMSPQQKTELMEELESVDYHILMCGDGANDCGALKRAHVGLSLSEYDASVAAPFTARTENGVASVITLIREGRAALVTSFGMFKFMALYSLIQFTTVLLLYGSDSNLSDYEFLYIDLIIIDVVALTMSRNHAHKILHWKKPSSSLISMEMLVSLFLQIILQFVIQFGTYILVQRQCWYTESTVIEHSDISDNNETTFNTTESTVVTTPANYSSCPPLANVPYYEFTEDDYPKTYEATSLFFLSSFMYMSVSVTFSRGRPFRTPIYKNFWFLLCLLVLIGVTLFFMFGAPTGLEDFMEFRAIPDLNFSLILFGIACGHFLLSLCIELLFIEHPTLWNWARDKCRCCRRDRGKRYKYIMKVLQGQHFVDGEFATVPARERHSSKENDSSEIKRPIFIPSMVVDQFMEPKEYNKRNRETDVERKTKL